MAFTKKVVAGQTIAAADFAKFFGDHFSEFVKTGFEVTEGTGLVVDISAGTAYVKDASGYMYQIVSGATETTTLADNSTNYVFLHSDNGATYITDSTTATVPDDAILLATVVTASGDVSTVTDERELTPRPQTDGLYIQRGTIVSLSGYSGTTSETIYFNPFSTKKITFGKIKYTYTNYASCTITVKYCVDDSNEVTLRTITGNDTGTVTDTINVGSSSIANNPYIKFTITIAGGSPSTRSITNLSVSYVMSD